MITARPATGPAIELPDVDPEKTTVAELKERLALHTQIGAGQMRLVAGGRILRDDALALAAYGVREGAQVSVVRLALNQTGPAASPTTPEAAGGRADALGQMLQAMPWLEQLVETPGFMEQALLADPRLRRMTESNPEVAQALRDPATMREMLRALRDPTARAHMEQNADRMLAQIESGAIPGAYQHLSSLFHGLEREGAADAPGAVGSDDVAERAFAERLGVRPGAPAGQPNAEALPNPWAAPSSAGAGAGARVGGGLGLPPGMPDFAQLAGLFPRPAAADGAADPFAGLAPLMQALAPGGAAPPMGGLDLAGLMGLSAPPPASTIAPTAGATADYDDALQQLADMGFPDRQANLRALRASGGRLESAVEYLLGHGG